MLSAGKLSIPGGAGVSFGFGDGSAISWVAVPGSAEIQTDPVLSDASIATVAEGAEGVEDIPPLEMMPDAKQPSSEPVDEAIEVTLAHPLSVELISSFWLRQTARLAVFSPNLDGASLLYDRLILRAQDDRSRRNGDDLLREIAPFQLRGYWEKSCPGAMAGEKIDMAIDERISGAFYMMGVRGLSVPLDDPAVAKELLFILLYKNPVSLREFARAHPTVIREDSLPFEIADAKARAKAIKRVVKRIKAAAYPHRYDVKKLAEVIGSNLKDRDNDFLALLMTFSRPLELPNLYYGGDSAIIPGIIARLLLARDGLTNGHLLAAIANCLDHDIFTAAVSRLDQHSACDIEACYRQAKLVIAKCMSERCASVDKEVPPVLGVLEKFVLQGDAPQAVLEDLTRSSLGIDDKRKPALAAERDKLCLHALRRTSDNLTGPKILEYFSSKGADVPLAVKRSLFSHPAMPKQFARRILFVGDKPVDFDLAAFQMLRPTLEDALINRLALRRQNSPALRAALMEDPALERKTRLALMRGSHFDAMEQVSKEYEAVLIKGIEYLWASLTQEEFDSLLPTGHPRADIMLTRHPLFSKEARLAFLENHLHSTHTFCDRMVGREVVLTCFNEGADDFTDADFVRLFRVLQSWSLKDHDVAESVLFHHKADPSPEILGKILRTQIGYHSLSYEEWPLKNYPELSNESSSYEWLMAGHLSPMRLAKYGRMAPSYFRRLQDLGQIDAEWRIKDIDDRGYRLGSEAVRVIHDRLGISWEDAHGIREIFDGQKSNHTLAIKYQDLVFFITFTPEDYEKIKRVLEHEKYAAKRSAIQAALTKEILCWIVSSSSLLRDDKYRRQEERGEDDVMGLLDQGRGLKNPPTR